VAKISEDMKIFRYHPFSLEDKFKEDPWVGDPSVVRETSLTLRSKDVSRIDWPKTLLSENQRIFGRNHSTGGTFKDY